MPLLLLVLLVCVMLGVILHVRLPLHGKRLVIAERALAVILLVSAVVVLVAHSSEAIDFVSVAVLLVAAGTLFLNSRKA